jgi:hypothetical protein
MKSTRPAGPGDRAGRASTVDTLASYQEDDMPENKITVNLLRPKDRPFFKLAWVEPDSDRRRRRSAKTAGPVEAEKKGSGTV